jgi:1A family penicillin-binding protein
VPELDPDGPDSAVPKPAPARIALPPFDASRVALIARRLLIVLALVVVGATVAGGGTLIWALHDVPLLAAPPELKSFPIVLEAADGKAFARKGAIRVPDAERKDYPAVLVNAVTSIEDRRFYHHWGIDLAAIFRAAGRDLSAGEIVQGGSTITQQLVKLLLHDDERSFGRKLREAVIALWLERQLSKDEILTRYLNSVYLGGGAVGMPTAARMLFGKKPAELTLPEAAMLAGLIKAPSQLSPLKSLNPAQARAALVLDAMVDAGAIDKATAEDAKLHPATLKLDEDPSATGSWFGDWVFDQATALAGSRSGPMRLRTTLDPRLQALAEATIKDALAGPAKATGVSQAALVAMRPDGAVVAMVGGGDYGQSVFNRAVQAKRQPGSAFKLFVYLAALRHGFTIHDLVDDTPLDIDGWQPQNFDGRFHGRVTLADAFAHSLNVASARLAMEVGIDQVIAAAHDLGIATPLGKNPSLALGTSEVSLLDLTAAYAAVSAGSMPVKPWGIAAYGGEDQARLVRVGQANPPKRTLEPYRQSLLTLLQLVISNGTGKAAQLPGFAAGKTGTSQNHRDAWFIGFNESLVVGVWVGNDDNTPMDAVTGGSLPAAMWKDFLTRASASVVAGAAPAVTAAPSLAAAPPAAPAASASPGAAPAVASGAPAPAAPAASLDRTKEGSAGPAPSGDFSPVAPAAPSGDCDVDACARSYHSFRAADCTYQPLDRGPRRVCDKPPTAGPGPQPSVAMGYNREPAPASPAPLGYVGGPPPTQQPIDKIASFLLSEQSKAQITCSKVHMGISWTNNGRSWRCIR